MGSIVNIKCKKCGIDKDFFIGSGMIYTGTEVVIGFCKSCKEYKLIARENKLISREEKNKTLSKCECGDTPVVVFDEEMIDENITSTKCLICGEDMEISKTGLFD